MTLYPLGSINRGKMHLLLTPSTADFRANSRSRCGAFTLLELLVVIGIICMLAALIFPGLEKARQRARCTQCIGNLKQIAAAVLMYADDHGQRLPGRRSAKVGVSGWHAYRSLMSGYVRSGGSSASNDTLFICPADKFHWDLLDRPEPTGWHERADLDHCSYGFNNANLIQRKAGTIYPKELLGVGLEQLTSILEPSKTVMIAEITAWSCYSWHEARAAGDGNYRINNARNVTSFVDGHVKYIRFHYDKLKGPECWYYDPPSGYEYRWSAR